jgi:hypothetical protein
MEIAAGLYYDKKIKSVFTKKGRVREMGERQSWKPKADLFDL